MCCHWDKLSHITVLKVYLEDITTEITQPNLPNLIQWFIHNQQHHDSHSESYISVSDLPTVYGKMTVYPSAVAMFHTSSDISGIGGMCCEHICTVKSWRKGPGHYDTIYVNTDPSMEDMQGLNIAHMWLFFHSVIMVSNICKGTSVHSLTSPVPNYVYMYSPRSPYISDHIYTTPTSLR
jgi:hypothetical protein